MSSATLESAAAPEPSLEAALSRNYLAEVMVLPQPVVDLAVKKARYYHYKDRTFDWNLAHDNEFGKFNLST